MLMKPENTILERAANSRVVIINKRDHEQGNLIRFIILKKRIKKKYLVIHGPVELTE